MFEIIKRLFVVIAAVILSLIYYPTLIVLGMVYVFTWHFTGYYMYHFIRYGKKVSRREDTERWFEIDRTIDDKMCFYSKFIDRFIKKEES